MQFTETAPQQAEHFEWMNHIESYQSFLQSLTEKISTVKSSDFFLPEEDREEMQSRLYSLKNRLYALSYSVSEHIDEIEMVPVVDNRLELDLQAVHHFGLRDKLSRFEEEMNAFRDDLHARLLPAV